MSNPQCCANCHEPLTPGVRFCESCGFAVTITPNPSSQPLAPPPPPIPTAPAQPKPEAPLMLSSIPAPTPKPVNPVFAATPQRQNSSRGSVVGIIVTILLIVIVSMAYIILTQKKKSPTVVAVNNGATPPVVTPDTTPAGATPQPVPETPNKSTLDFTRGDTYLPAAGLKLTFHEKYVSGEEGDWVLVTAIINEETTVSTAQCLDSINATPDNISVMHYLMKIDGIWEILDIRPADRTLFLPLSIEKGVSFSASGVTGKIIAIGQTCDLGFKTFTDCLVVKRDFKEVGYQEYQYFAPGYGIILTKEGNTVMRQLTKVEQMDEKKATAFVRSHSQRPDGVPSK